MAGPDWSTSERFVGTLPRMSAPEAAELVDENATVLVSGFGSVGDPKAVPAALAASGRDLSLTVVSGGSTGPHIDSELVDADAIERRLPFQGRDEIRTAINDGQIAFHDTHIARLGEMVETGGLVESDIAVVEAVAVGPDWLVPTTSIGQTPAYVASADEIIVEVNREQPLALQQFHDVYRPGLPPNREPIPLSNPDDRIGTPRIQFDSEKLVGVVESGERDTPYTFREPTAVDETIAENLLGFLSRETDRNPVLSEALTLQFGVGSLGNALMEAVQDLDGPNVRYYGEVIQDGLLDLIERGTLESASATSLALSADGQERLFSDIERYADSVVLRPADVSNRAELIDRFGVVAINSALEVDIYGHVNSTHIGGRNIVSGVGGSGDFNQNSHLAVTALPSNVDEDRSRIVPHAPHIDHTEHDVDVIVTERGVADLRGLGPRERAQTLVENCAHPAHRGALFEYLDRADGYGGHLPFDPETAFDWF